MSLVWRGSATWHVWDLQRGAAAWYICDPAGMGHGDTLVGEKYSLLGCGLFKGQPWIQFSGGGGGW